MKIDSLRREYTRGELNEKSVSVDPFDQFAKWFQQATHSDIEDVSAMSLATTDKEGKPSVRIVLLKKFDENGFMFFTNYQGRKAKELHVNPYAALLFYWKELDRQIRIEGTIKKSSSSESTEYFDSRSLESRISAVISPQSETIPSRRFLEDKWVEYLKRIDEEGIHRPEEWGGFKVIPQRIEFWQGRPNRLHDRILYLKTKSGWEVSRLAP